MKTIFEEWRKFQEQSEQEKDIVSAIIEHINKNTPIEKQHIEQIRQAIRTNQLKKPSVEKVYRGLSLSDLGTYNTNNKIGSFSFELFGATYSIYDSPFVYKPQKNADSFTTMMDIAIAFSAARPEDKMYSVILEAELKGQENSFLDLKDFSKKVINQTGSSFETEDEVLSLGEIKISKVHISDRRTWK